MGGITMNHHVWKCEGGANGGHEMYFDWEGDDCFLSINSVSTRLSIDAIPVEDDLRFEEIKKRLDVGKCPICDHDFWKQGE